MPSASVGHYATLSFVVGGNKIAAGKPLPQNLIYDLNDFNGFNDFNGLLLTIFPSYLKKIPTF